jgi:hypothetical protein
LIGKAEVLTEDTLREREEQFSEEGWNPQEDS